MMYKGLKNQCKDYFEFLEKQMAWGLDTIVQLPPRPPVVVNDHYNLHGLPVSYDARVGIREWSESDDKGTWLIKEYETPDAFTRTTYVRGLARDPAPMGAAFSLTEPGQISEPVDFKQGCVIFELIERPSLDLSEYNAVRDSLYFTVLNNKRQALYSAWVDNLIANSVIQNNIERTLEEARAF